MTAALDKQPMDAEENTARATERMGNKAGRRPRTTIIASMGFGLSRVR